MSDHERAIDLLRRATTILADDPRRAVTVGAIESYLEDDAKMERTIESVMAREGKTADELRDEGWSRMIDADGAGFFGIPTQPATWIKAYDP